MTNKISFDEIERFVAREGVTRRAFPGKNSMMVINEIEPHAQPAIHSHMHEQITYILQGECDFILGDETVRMKKGDVILIPPDVRHGLRPIGNETIINIDVFSPIREDYLI